MKPFYFGAPAKPLFGVYTAPGGHQPPRGAVLLCYPFGPEYLRSHRALRELSHHLSLRGQHTLRFDYFGCGDSAGATEDGTMEQWLEDIAHAVDELREASGFRRVSLLGLRFGATLAALFAGRDRDIAKLVLWDPIVSGSAYLKELSRRNRDFMQGRARPRGWTPSEPPDEVLGTPLPDALRASMGRADLLVQASPLARRIFIITTEKSPAAEALAAHLRTSGAETEYRHVPSPALWLKQDQVERALVPQEVIQRIGTSLGETA